MFSNYSYFVVLTIPNLTAKLLDEESNLTAFEESGLAMSTVTQKFNKMKFETLKYEECEFSFKYRSHVLQLS